MAIISKEEHARRQKRRMRQAIGLVMLGLIVLGVMTVFSWGVRGVNHLLDDSDERTAYGKRLQGLVMFDPLPFDTLDQADQLLFKQAAVWGCVYGEMETSGSLDAYERDPDTDCLILPALELNAYLAQLLGPDYTVADETFETNGMVYLYDSEKQGYLVPVTGAVGSYTPQVEKLQRRDGKLYVTVGYIRINSSDFSTASTDPVKYMDYVFSRGKNRTWYLTGLVESAMKPAASAPAADDSFEYDLDYNPTQALQEAISSVGDGVELAVDPADSAAAAADNAAADETADVDGEPTEENADSAG